jgi:peptide/nickel transport system substrate-binding protein
MSKASYINVKGIDAFNRHPVGTGPYRFSEWKKGQYIKLEKNHGYWDKGIPAYDTLQFKILPESKWVEALKNDEVDVVTNIHPDTIGVIESDPDLKVMKRSVLQGYWIMLKFQGPLKKLAVRKALNYAVDKTKMIQVQNGGLGTVLSSLGKSGEIGKNRELSPYPYDPATARKLLASAGYPDGFSLKAITIQQAKDLTESIKEDLDAVGINLELEIVSRPEWAQKVIVGKITGNPYAGDMAINLVDNPIVNMAFHAGLFLESSSPWSLAQDPVFDKRFRIALHTASFPKHVKALMGLDKYIHDNAMMLFTFQPVRVFAMKKDVKLPGIGINGHIDYYIFTHEP